jgi:isopentenyl-diphosphate delta-isomerase
VAKAIALGADIAGLAWPFLAAASESTEALHGLVQLLIAEIKTSLFCTGMGSLGEFKLGNVLHKLT